MRSVEPKPTCTSLIEGILARDRAIIARAISVIEGDNAEADGLYMQICSLNRSAPIVAFTGPPGVGKSSLISAYIGCLRQQHKTVAVAAVDPSSAFHGGAILGDRIRMVEHDGDQDVFIRSIASRGHRGTLSATLYRVTDIFSAAGYDVVVVETIGAGQADLEVADLADVKIVVGAPGLGDDVQAIKAGILEIADILVLNKADRPFAEQALMQLEATSRLRAGHARDVPVIATVATSNSGISDLAAAVEARVLAMAMVDRGARTRARVQKLLAQAASRLVGDYVLRQRSAPLAQTCDDIAAGRTSFLAAAKAVLGEVYWNSVARTDSPSDIQRRR